MLTRIASWNVYSGIIGLLCGGYAKQGRNGGVVALSSNVGPWDTIVDGLRDEMSDDETNDDVKVR